MKSAEISCPQCGESVDPQTRSCEHCGVSLVLAALLAERELTSGPIVADRIPISPEILVPRLGAYLIEKGLLEPEDLHQALAYQSRQEALGRPCLIGRALVDLGYIDNETLDQAITEQIFQLHSALQHANLDLEKRVRQRTNELENALNRLAELNQLKSNFIANISHELRTPLTHIKGYVELLLGCDLGPITQNQLDGLKVIKKSEERLEQLIEDLIQFSLVARGELDLNLTRVNLQEILDSVIEESSPKFKRANLTLETKIPQKLPTIQVDFHKIVWVLTQLMDNAIKFTPKGGKIGLEVQLGKKRVTLSLLDTGIGIESARFDEIFEPFHQLDGSATRKYGGTGLGLAMAKQIIEAHGSTIKVKSNVGQGSYFEFSLPIFGDS